jgi:hypothetical protein
VYLTADSIVPYLLQRGVLAARHLVRNDWFVARSDLKRPVLRVSTLAGSGWIVKQASPIDRTHVRLLDREAGLYQLAHKEPWARPLRALLPRVRAYDPGVHVLIVEQLPYDTGWDYLRRISARAEVIGRLLGRALAAAHLRIPLERPPTLLFTGRLPWVLQLNRADPRQVEESSTRGVLEMIRDESSIAEALVRLEHDWRPETLIHGDAKLDNVMIRAHRRPRVWLIDWAFAGLGDPAWDVGSMVQSSLLLWLYAIPFKRDVPFDEAATQSAFPLALVRSFTTTFVSSYLVARSLRGRAAGSFVRRAFRFAGAALVQSALADARTHDQLTPRQLAMLQMSSRILENPDEASRELWRDP